MTRNYLEAITGIFTGNDMLLELTSSHTSMGQLGEEHQGEDNSVWFTKSHFPGLRIPSVEHTSDKAIVITRNPLDVLVSWFYFDNTKSHSLVCEERINSAFPEEWDQTIKGMTAHFKLWHGYILRELSGKIPVFLFRYEDVTQNSN